MESECFYGPKWGHYLMEGIIRLSRRDAGRWYCTLRKTDRLFNPLLNAECLDCSWTERIGSCLNSMIYSIIRGYVSYKNRIDGLINP